MSRESVDTVATQSLLHTVMHTKRLQGGRRVINDMVFLGFQMV